MELHGVLPVSSLLLSHGSNKRGKGFPVGIRKLNERVDRKNRAPKARASEGKALKRNFEGQLGNPKKTNMYVYIINTYDIHTHMYICI